MALKDLNSAHTIQIFRSCSKKGPCELESALALLIVSQGLHEI